MPTVIKSFLSFCNENTSPVSLPLSGFLACRKRKLIVKCFYHKVSVPPSSLTETSNLSNNCYEIASTHLRVYGYHSGTRPRENKAAHQRPLFEEKATSTFICSQSRSPCHAWPSASIQITDDKIHIMLHLF